MLLGQQAGAIPRPLFGRRTLVYLGYIVLFMVLLWLPGVVFIFSVIGSFPTATEHDFATSQRIATLGALAPLLILFYFVFFYFMTRFSLVFPAVAVDRKLGLGGSWRLTRGGSGFKAYALLIVIILLCLVGTLIGMFVINALASLLWLTPDLAMRSGEINWTNIVVSQLPKLIGALLLEFLSFVVILAAVTVAYAQLSGWGAARQELPERFE